MRFKRMHNLNDDVTRRKQYACITKLTELVIYQIWIGVW